MNDDDPIDISEDRSVDIGIVIAVEIQAQWLREQRLQRSERSKRGHANRKARLAKP